MTDEKKRIGEREGEVENEMKRMLKGFDCGR